VGGARGEGRGGRRGEGVRGKGVDQSLINQLESIIIVFIKYQNQSIAADEKNG